MGIASRKQTDVTLLSDCNTTLWFAKGKWKMEKIKLAILARQQWQCNGLLKVKKDFLEKLKQYQGNELVWPSRKYLKNLCEMWTDGLWLI